MALEHQHSMNQKAKDAIQARKEAGLPARRSPTEIAQADPKSLRKAITAFCYECMGGDGEPGARREVTNCSSRRCPLHGHRPWQRSEDDE